MNAILTSICQRPRRWLHGVVGLWLEIQEANRKAEAEEWEKTRRARRTIEIWDEMHRQEIIEEATHRRMEEKSNESSSATGRENPKI